MNAVLASYFYLRSNGWAPCYAWAMACELNDN